MKKAYRPEHDVQLLSQTALVRKKTITAG